MAGVGRRRQKVPRSNTTGNNNNYQERSGETSRYSVVAENLLLKGLVEFGHFLFQSLAAATVEHTFALVAIALVNHGIPAFLAALNEKQAIAFLLYR